MGRNSRNGARRGYNGPQKAKRDMKKLLPEILQKGYTSLNQFLTIMWSTDMIRSTTRPELAKRHIARCHPNDPMLNLFSLHGAGINTGITGSGKATGARKFSEKLADAGGVIPVNQGGLVIYCCGSGRDNGWASPMEVKQADGSGTVTVSAKCPGLETWASWEDEGESHKHLSQAAHGIMFDSKCMKLEAAVDSELKKSCLTCTDPLIAIQSDMIRFKEPYPWDDVTLRQTRGSYIDGVAGKCGSPSWHKLARFLLDNATYVLAANAAYKLKKQLVWEKKKKKNNVSYSTWCVCVHACECVQVCMRMSVRAGVCAYVCMRVSVCVRV